MGAFERFVAWVMRLWRFLAQGPLAPTYVFSPLPKEQQPEVDWFVWESEQIQDGGYCFWFDHWRYDEQPWAFEEPTEAQRGKVFKRSHKKALERGYTQAQIQRASDAVADHLEAKGFTTLPRYGRVREMGQDPVRWGLDYARDNGLI